MTTLVSSLNKVLNMVTRKQQRKRQPKQTSRRRMRARVVTPRMRVNTIPAAVNTASSIRSKQPGVQRQSNTDRLIQKTIPAGMPTGGVVVDQIVSTTITDRLRAQASLYQRIRYIRLTFEIQTQTPTTVSGGYVAAFVKDPELVIGSGISGLKRLTAVQDAKTTKWWQSTVIDIKPNQMDYYCANGNDIRWFSPGRLVILCDGSPNQPVEVTVVLKWHVELKEPALQALPVTLPQVVLTATKLQYSERTSGGTDGRLRAFNTNSAGLDTEIKIVDAFTGLPSIGTIAQLGGLWYQLPYPVTSSNSNSEIRTMHFIKFDQMNADDLECELYALPLSNSKVEEHFEDNIYFVRGTTFSPIVSSEILVDENSTSGFWIASPSPSVTQHLMISKRFQETQPAESSQLSTTVESQLSMLCQQMQLQ
ncbi:capsid protein [Ceratitis capitata nodavirus 1]|nr:capsid protein [Ceratitis capitata nodavirus 1]